MRFIGAVLCGVLCIVPALPGAARADDVVKVDGGQVSGTIGADGSVRMFKGIPFAKAPIGDLRWKAPLPVEPWQGVRKADEFGPGCFQPPPSLGYKLPVSEDCLFVNVWTGARATTEKRPVLVWIYGGDFITGTPNDPRYDGEALAKRGVVYVSIAYRVGRFGSLVHPDLTRESGHNASGNYGLLDQIAALRWIKDNIAAFGGNPDAVTIMGQDSGAYSVSYLMASPLAKGLFHQAIVESGGGFGPITDKSSDGYMLPKLADAERAGVAFASSMGVTGIAELRAKSAAEILAAPSVGDRYNTQAPIIDGYVLPDSPFNIFMAHKQNDVPVLLGSNADEGAGVSPPMQPGEFADAAARTFGDNTADYLKLYPAATFDQTTKALADTLRDRKYGWQIWTLARLEAKAGQPKIYYYYFDHAPKLHPGQLFGTRKADQSGSLGVFHGSEIFYVLHTLDSYAADWQPADRKLTDQLSSYWVNFVATGNPNGKELPHWAAFDGARPMALIIADDIKMGPVPNRAQYDFWDRIFHESPPR